MKNQVLRSLRQRCTNMSPGGIELLSAQSKMASHPAISFMHVEEQQFVLSFFPKKGPSIRSASDDSALQKQDLALSNAVPLAGTRPTPLL